jgi:hypothetical protein
MRVYHLCRCAKLGRIARRLETFAGNLIVTVPAIAVEVLHNTSNASTV